MHIDKCPLQCKNHTLCVSHRLLYIMLTSVILFFISSCSLTKFLLALNNLTTFWDFSQRHRFLVIHIGPTPAQNKKKRLGNMFMTPEKWLSHAEGFGSTFSLGFRAPSPDVSYPTRLHVLTCFPTILGAPVKHYHGEYNPASPATRTLPGMHSACFSPNQVAICTLSSAIRDSFS